MDVIEAKKAKLVCTGTNEYELSIQSSFLQGNHPYAFPHIPRDGLKCMGAKSKARLAMIKAKKSQISM